MAENKEKINYKSSFGKFLKHIEKYEKNFDEMANLAINHSVDSARYRHLASTMSALKSVGVEYFLHGDYKPPSG